MEVEGEIGRISVDNGSNLVPEHQPKERIYTLSQQELFLMVGASMSYHKGLELLNLLLHRNADATIKFRTYRDFCERTGARIEEELTREADEILEAQHFDTESGKATEAIAPALREGAVPRKEDAALRDTVEKYNAAHPEEDEQIKLGNRTFENSEESVYLSLDEIGVKHQKEHRSGKEQKQGVYVWNTVADIKAGDSSCTVTASGMETAFRIALACLLKYNLLAGKNLVFFTDGAKNIFKNIEEMFSFRPYTVILDWFHLKKRCQECLSMSVNGKEQRNAILQKLLRILWAGNTDQAIAYLHNLPKTSLRPQNRIDELCGYLEKHREHIPSYALRAKLGLRNSSNRVEKANDLVVAQRQKHNGMSWSTSGSGALAQITALIMNDQLHSGVNGTFSLPALSAA